MPKYKIKCKRGPNTSRKGVCAVMLLERETAYKACKLHLQKPLKCTATNRQPGGCQNVQKIHRRNKESGCTNTYIYLSVRHSKKNCLFVKCAESSSVGWLAEELFCVKTY
ncbi:hypothetical protein T4A_8771 [Trichinella pseudospiralis]|uniref:Uncharacterized protein n=1 Tax=Trichinella pseudospiralis TaxID=6337 RepID=A0A0V1DSE7_TRIPS|nr:hypothetical protein T4A_8771 [Trichinella pseudospiralis]